MKCVLIQFVLVCVITNASRSQWKQLDNPNNADYTWALIAHDSKLFQYSNNVLLSYYDSNAPHRWISADSGLYGEADKVTCLGATTNAIFAGVSTGRVFRSTNDGALWVKTAILTGHQGASIGGLANSDSVLFVAASSDGIYRSTDLGYSWTRTSQAPVTSIFAKGDTVVGGLGVFSTDKGLTWTQRIIQSDIKCVSMLGPYVFVGTAGWLGAGQVMRSMNLGVSWDTVLSGPWDVNALAICGSNMLAGTQKGLYVSTDSGNTWTPQNDGLPTPAISINCFAVDDSLVYAGTDGKGPYVRSIYEMVPRKAAVIAPRLTLDSISIYPNPTLGSVTVRSGSELQQVTLLNVLGAQVLSLSSMHTNEVTLDLLQLPTGTYFVQLETTAGRTVRKITRE